MSLDPRIHALQTRPEATPAQAGFSLAAFASVFVPWYLGNFLLFHYRAGASEWLSAAAVPAAFSLAHVFVLHNLFWCGCMLWVRHRTHALTHLTDFMFQRHKWYWFQDPKRDPSFKRKFVEGGLYLLQFLAFILTPTLLSVHLPWMLHLSLLSPSEGREEMRLIDSSLGRPLPERSYGEGCDQWDQVYETFNDFFVFVHFVGFLLMSLAMRSFTIPFLISIWDEVLEFSLEHIFPNFKECWWDHALADLFGANLFGCLIGFCLLRACGVEPVSWLAPSSRFGDNDCNNQDDNENDLNRHSLLPRSLGLRLKQFLFGRDKTAFIFVSLIFVHRTIIFVLPFAFKYVMWVPVPHLLFVYHGVAHFGLQMMSYLEHYNHYLFSLSSASSSSTSRPLRPHHFIWRTTNVAMMALETILVIKMLLYGYDDLALVPPMHIIVAWGVIIALWVFFFFSSSSIIPSIGLVDVAEKTTTTERTNKKKMNVNDNNDDAEQKKKKAAMMKRLKEE